MSPTRPSAVFARPTNERTARKPPRIRTDNFTRSHRCSDNFPAVRLRDVSRRYRPAMAFRSASKRCDTLATRQCFWNSFAMRGSSLCAAKISFDKTVSFQSCTISRVVSKTDTRGRVHTESLPQKWINRQPSEDTSGKRTKEYRIWCGMTGDANAVRNRHRAILVCLRLTPSGCEMKDPAGPTGITDETIGIMQMTAVRLG